MLFFAAFFNDVHAEDVNSVTAEELTLPSSAVPPFAPAAIRLSHSEASKILGMAADSQKAAYDAIRTWKGSATLSSIVAVRSAYIHREKVAGRFLQRRDGTIQFTRDQPNRMLLSRYEGGGAARVTDRENGTTFRISERLNRVNLVRPDGNYSKRIGGTSIRRDKVKRPASYWIGSQCFDPCCVFYKGGHRIDSLIAMYSNELQDPSIQDLFRVSR